MPRRTQVLSHRSLEFRIRGCHPLRRSFPEASPILTPQLSRQSYNPVFTTVWAPPLSLATTYGIVFYFLLLEVLRCFSSLRSLHLPMCSVNDDIPLRMPGSPIRISTDRCLLTAPRSVSPFAASFFASLCLGIRHTLFLP